MRVLLLHSGGMSSRQWRRLNEALSAQATVQAPDLLGSGANPVWPDERPFSLEVELESLESQAQWPAHVVGHSYGGLLGLMLARRNPSRVLSLALYDPVAFGVLAGDAAGSADLARVNDHPLFLDDRSGGGEEWWRLFIEYWNGPGAWDGLPETTRESFLRVGRKVYYEVRGIAAERTPTQAYADVTCPVLLMYGEKSPVAAQRVCHVLGAALPNARVVGVPAGHMGPITHPDRVNGLILQHLPPA